MKKFLCICLVVLIFLSTLVSIGLIRADTSDVFSLTSSAFGWVQKFSNSISSFVDNYVAPPLDYGEISSSLLNRSKYVYYEATLDGTKYYFCCFQYDSSDYYVSTLSDVVDFFIHRAGFITFIDCYDSNDNGVYAFSSFSSQGSVKAHKCDAASLLTIFAGCTVYG